MLLQLHATGKSHIKIKDRLYNSLSAEQPRFLPPHNYGELMGSSFSAGAGAANPEPEPSQVQCPHCHFPGPGEPGSCCGKRRGQTVQGEQSSRGRVQLPSGMSQVSLSLSVVS